MQADPAQTSEEMARPVVVQKWIALGVGKTLPAPVMTYVLGACRRMQTGLLLLTRDALQTRTLLAAYLPELRGIDCFTEELASASPAALVQTLNLHRGVLFAVCCGSDDDPLAPLLRSRRRLRSPVPVVVVSQKAGAGTPS